MDDKPLDQDAIDALLKTTGKAGRPPRAAAGRKGGNAPAEPVGKPVSPEDEANPEAAVPPVSMPALGARRPASPRDVYASISQVPVEIAVVLGDLELPISEILKLKPGSVMQLDAWVDAPVEIRMRGRTVARAQIVTLEDTYALRIVENLVAAPDFPPS